MNNIPEAIEATTTLVNSFEWRRLIFIGGIVLLAIALWKSPEIINALKY